MKKYFQKKADVIKRIVGVSEVKRGGYFIKELAQSLWSARGKKEEGVPVSIASLNVPPEQLAQVKKTWKRLLTLFLIFTVLLLIYVSYAYFKKDYATAIVALALVLVCLAQSFRYHFWLFQLRMGKLGCTVGEWFKHGFKAE